MGLGETLRILVVSNIYPPHYLGGYELLCQWVSNTLIERGHDVAVLTSTFGSGYADTEEDGVRVRRSLRLITTFGERPDLGRMRRRRVARHNARQLREMCDRTRPDVVFVWSQLRLTLGCAQAAEATGHPVVYSMNDSHIAGYLPAAFRPTPKGLFRYVTDRTVFRDVCIDGLGLKHVACCSESLKEELIEGGVRLQDARVIYQGIPVEVFPVKESPGTVHDPLRLLYVGQVHPYKGVHTAIDACRQLAAKRGEDSVRLTIAGQASADYEDRLRTQANGLGGVRFLGKVEYRKLPEIYREHDIFVFPSIWREPFGLTHLEAMASGTVVVSTTEGGQGELIRDGENALTFHSEDAVSLVSAIERLLEDGDLGPRLAREARQMVVDRFTRPRYADEMEALLLQAAGRSPGPT